jgi:hypothetical protein
MSPEAVVFLFMYLIGSLSLVLGLCKAAARGDR